MEGQSNEEMFDVESLRNPYESNSEWEKRKCFLETHRDKFDLDRLVCLSNCYINWDIYGSRYPALVMAQLKELCAELPKPEKTPIRKQGVHMMKFVKAAEPSCSTESSISPQNITSFSAPVQQKKAVVQGMNFVKADSEFRSTDIALNQSHTVQNFSAAAPSSKRMGFGNPNFTKCKADFQASLHQYQSDCQQTDSNEMDEKFRMLSKIVIECQKLPKNSIEILHMAASKSKMSVVDSFQGGPASSAGQMTFICNVEIDCVSVAKGFGSNKKTAKHNAFTEAINLLANSYIRVIESPPGHFILAPESAGLCAPGMSYNYSEGMPSFKRPSPRSQPSLQPKKRSNRSQVLDDLAQFILIDHSWVSSINPVSKLANSGSFNKVAIEYDYEYLPSGQCCHVYVGEQYVASGEGEDKISSKAVAAENALEELKQICFTLRIKQQVDTDGESSQSAGMTKDEVLSNIQGGNDVIPDSNIGNMLLRKMGWVGGGVGKDGTGIAEPVKAEHVIGRSGLGLSSAEGIPRDFQSRIQTVINDYVSSSNQYDIHFSPEFSKEERAIIHKVGQKFNLKTTSYGKGDDRYLVISRKRNVHELVDHVMQSGGSTSKYDLLPPQDQDFLNVSF